MHMHSFSAILAVVPQTGTILGEGGRRGINGPHRLMGWLCDTKITVAELRVPSLNAAGVLLYRLCSYYLLIKGNSLILPDGPYFHLTLDGPFFHPCVS